MSPILTASRMLCVVALAWICGLTPNMVAAADGTKPSHLRLVDRLDRPSDGYCLDILGTPGYLRPDLPLFAHNCKSGLTVDSAVTFGPEGQIRFVEPDLCVTVAGVNSRALPGASILVRPCGEATAFFETARLQRFTHEKDGRIVLEGTDLCLAVGSRSATTYSPADAWRALFVAACDKVESRLARWEFVVPIR